MKKRKLKLDLEKLAVETFEASADADLRGTVKGQDSVGTTYGPWFCPYECPCDSDPNSC